MSEQPKVTLTIAGNDASGGAGIAADLKTFAEFGTYGIATLTVVATMDPENNWNHGTNPLDAQLVKEQLVTATAGPELSALKTGMLPNVPVIETIAEHIKDHRLDNLVVDPVMVCKGEDEVLNPENANALREILTPLATVATPNLFEAGQLSGLGTLHTVDDMKEAAKLIHEKGAKNVVVKGGRALKGDKAIDLFYDGKDFTVLEDKKIENPTNHGAGCTFAAAITSGLANGLAPKEAVSLAKEFVTEAIKSGFVYNQYVGSVYHSGYRLNKQNGILG